MSNARNIASGAKFVDTAGDTMTGNLTVSGGLVSATGTSTATNPESDIGLYHSLKNLSSDVNTGVALALGSNNNSGAIIYGQRTGSNNEHKMGFQTRNNAGSAATRMSIDGSGRVTTPYQPAFSTRGTGYTQVNAAFSTVKPATTELNVGNHYNSSTGVWTVPVSGNYLVTANGLIYPSGTGGSGSVHNTAWYKNGSQWEDIQNGEYYTNHTNITNTAIIPCGANDTLDFRFYRHSGSGAPYSGQFIMYGYLLG